MKNPFSALVFLLIIFFSAPAWGDEALSLDDVVRKIQDTYERTGQVKARFTQTVTLKAMKKTERGGSGGGIGTTLSIPAAQQGRTGCVPQSPGSLASSRRF